MNRFKIETVTLVNSKGDELVCNKGDEKNFKGFKIKIEKKETKKKEAKKENS